MRQNETVFQNIAAPPRTNRPGLATNHVSHIVSELSRKCLSYVPGASRRWSPSIPLRQGIGGASPSPQSSPVKRPLRNLPHEAMSGVVNDTILAKPPTPLDTGLRRYDGCAKVSSRERREAPSPPLWIPAFAGMTVVQRSRQGRGGRRHPHPSGYRPSPV